MKNNKGKILYSRIISIFIVSALLILFSCPRYSRQGPIRSNAWASIEMETIYGYESFGLYTYVIANELDDKRFQDLVEVIKKEKSATYSDGTPSIPESDRGNYNLFLIPGSGDANLKLKIFIERHLSRQTNLEGKGPFLVSIYQPPNELLELDILRTQHQKERESFAALYVDLSNFNENGFIELIDVYKDELSTVEINSIREWEGTTRMRVLDKLLDLGANVSLARAYVFSWLREIFQE